MYNVNDYSISLSIYIYTDTLLSLYASIISLQLREGAICDLSRESRTDLCDLDGLDDAATKCDVPCMFANIE